MLYIAVVDIQIIPAEPLMVILIVVCPDGITGKLATMVCHHPGLPHI
jgi:hypothetical protein